MVMSPLPVKSRVRSMTYLPDSLVKSHPSHNLHACGKHLSHSGCDGRHSLEPRIGGVIAQTGAGQVQIYNHLKVMMCEKSLGFDGRYPDAAV